MLAFHADYYITSASSVADFDASLELVFALGRDNTNGSLTVTMASIDMQFESLVRRHSLQWNYFI